MLVEDLEEGKNIKRQREKRNIKSAGLKIGTLNIGTLTGKGRELADMMQRGRGKVKVSCLQDTTCKGSMARSIGEGFKLYYQCVDRKRNTVGMI